MKPGSWGLVALIVMAVWGWFAYTSGARSVQHEWDQERVVVAERIAELERAAGKVTVATVTEYVDRVRVIYSQGETIIKEVPVYVSSDLPLLPGGFRLLHDAAAGGYLPAAPDPSGPQPAPVAPGTVAATVANNYAEHYRCLATVDGLRRLYEGVRDAARNGQAPD